MKNFVSILMSAFLAVTLLSNSFINVSANGDEETGNIPTVTSLFGDTTFATTILPVVKLPGVDELPNGMLNPIGFPAGEVKFGENGVKVSGLSDGNAKVCFPVRSVELNQGWGGKVGFWTGSKWKLLKTTFSTDQEDPTSMACATISQNGTYSFIKWIADFSKLPKVTETSTSCEYIYGLLINVMDDTDYHETYQTGTIDALLFDSLKNLAGKTVTATFLGGIPDGSYEITGTFTGILETADWDPNTYVLPATGTFTRLYSSNGWHWSLNFGDCTQDWVATWGD